MKKIFRFIYEVFIETKELERQMNYKTGASLNHK
jgi:hypothetical protein